MPIDPPPVRLLDQLRSQIRYLHYSIRTEQAYVDWVRSFVRFHGLRHPADMGGADVEAFLSWLAVERQVSVSTPQAGAVGLAVPVPKGAGLVGAVLAADRPPAAAAAPAGGAVAG